TRRAGWLRLDPGTLGVPITTAIKNAPPSLIATTAPNHFLAVADSALWAIDAASGQETNLTPRTAKVVSVAGAPAGSRVGAGGDVLVQAEENRAKVFYRVPLNGS